MSKIELKKHVAMQNYKQLHAEVHDEDIVNIGQFQVCPEKLFTDNPLFNADRVLLNINLGIALNQSYFTRGGGLHMGLCTHCTRNLRVETPGTTTH